MKYVVTGGNGFIGSHIVDQLINDNHEVHVIDNLSAEEHHQFYYNDKAKYHEIDICSTGTIETIMAGSDAVFHLAAEARIQPCIHNPLIAVENNTKGTASVLQAARLAGVRRVIYSSSSSIYGQAHKTSLREDIHPDCLNPYSVSKKAGEDLCRMYARLYDMETVILRYFNVYGPRQPLKGQYAPVVGLFLRQYRDNEPLTIVGSGKQRRDFTHVYDVVDANIKFVRAKKPGWTNEGCKHWRWNWGDVFNVGTGVNYSINEIVSWFSDYPTKTLPERPGESNETLANISKIRSAINWKPEKNLHDYMIDEIEKVGREKSLDEMVKISQEIGEYEKS